MFCEGKSVVESFFFSAQQFFVYLDRDLWRAKTENNSTFFFASFPRRNKGSNIQFRSHAISFCGFISFFLSLRNLIVELMERRKKRRKIPGKKKIKSFHFVGRIKTCFGWHPADMKGNCEANRSRAPPASLHQNDFVYILRAMNCGKNTHFVPNLHCSRRTSGLLRGVIILLMNSYLAINRIISLLLGWQRTDGDKF